MRIGFSMSTNTFNVFFDYKLTCVYTVAPSEGQEAAGLVELAEFLSLLRLRSTRVMQQS
jgi:hypothetical protein